MKKKYPLKMHRVQFVKLVASGNDFILFDLQNTMFLGDFPRIARKLCNRKMGIGADGLLVLEESKRADVRMRIFNADGSEAEMCGNGVRCVALYVSRMHSKVRKSLQSLTIETKAGIQKAQINNELITIGMTNPQQAHLDEKVVVNQHSLKVNCVNTGVPHTVILCDGIDGIDVRSLGRLIRFHRKFQPQGTNVNFLEPKALDLIRVRTYERGVEDETLACGTGSVASAVIYAIKLQRANLALKENFSIGVETSSGEILLVSFQLKNTMVSGVTLQGKAAIVFEGVCFLDYERKQ